MCQDGECAAWATEFSTEHLARVLRSSKGLLLRKRRGKDTFPPRSIAGWKPEEDYPSGEECLLLGVRLSEEEDHSLATSGITLPGEKFLGWSRWIQQAWYPKCRRCHKEMQYFFQIDSEKNIPHMLGDGGVGRLFVCPRHTEVIAYTWDCS